MARVAAEPLWPGSLAAPSSDLIEPSSFRSSTYQNVSLSAPIFYGEATAANSAFSMVAADEESHDSKVGGSLGGTFSSGGGHGSSGHGQVSSSNKAFNVGGQTKERNVLEQQRTRNAKRIVDYLANIEISCNEVAQNECKALLSILRRTLKVRLSSILVFLV